MRGRRHDGATRLGRAVRGALVACALGVAVVSAHAGEPPAGAGAQAQGDVRGEVRRLFDAAQAAVAKQDYQAAYDAYRGAWALQRSYDIVGNLGVVEVKLGKLRDRRSTCRSP